jgi:hypothetical protein
MVALAHRPPRLGLPPAAGAAIYLAALATSEGLLTYLANPAWGAAAHGATLAALLAAAAISRRAAGRAFAVGMSLPPTLRIAGLMLPPASFTPPGEALVRCLPLLGALAAAARSLGLSRRALGLHLRRWPQALVIGLTGLPLGAAQWLILRLHLLGGTPHRGLPVWTISVWGPGGESRARFAAALVLVAAGIGEEVLVRGLLLRVTQDHLGRWGVPYAALVAAALHLSARSPAQLALTLAAGVGWGWSVNRTGSLVGAAGAHGLANAVAFAGMGLIEAGWG